MPKQIFSIGHSNRSFDEFRALIKNFEIDAIADVRSSPFSRFNPDFNQASLRTALKSDNISYVFLGEELGGRPRRSSYYVDGRASYERMAADPNFKKGLHRLELGANKHTIALMCSELHPLDCHRCLLVGRHLKQRGFDVRHIISDCNVLTQADIERELLLTERRNNLDLFASDNQVLSDAYKSRSAKVAFSDRHEEQ